MSRADNSGSRLESAIVFFLIAGSVTSSLIAIIVVAVPIIAPLLPGTYTIPDVVKEWGGIIIGFYFGAFVTFAATVWKSDRKDREDGS